MSDAQNIAGGSRALTHSPAQPAPSPAMSAEHWQGRAFEEHDPAQAMAASWGLSTGANAGSPPLPPAGPPAVGHSFSNVSIYPGGPLPVQTQLTIGQPNDPYEQEADRVADQVMRMADPPPPVQRQGIEEAESSQTLAPMITPLVQRQDNGYQLNPPSLLAPADPAARYRLGGDRRLHIDPELQAVALRYAQQQLSSVNLMPNLAQLRLGSTSSIPLVPSPGAAAPAAAPQPLVPAGEGPETAREANPGDLLRAAMAVPIINTTLTQLRTRTGEHILHNWRRLQLGEQVGTVSALAVIGAGAIAGIISNAESRQWALGQLNGRVLPVPGLDWLRVEVNTSTDALMVGFHVDVGALLPSFLGFGPGSATAIGGPPEREEFIPGIQRSSDTAQPTAPQPNLESRFNASRSGGSPLPNEVRQFMEPRFGFDFSKVKVHNDADAVQMNRELGAQAFAHGNHIYYGAGKAPANDHLTGHELTHVVQQTGGVSADPNQVQPQLTSYIQRDGSMEGDPAAAISQESEFQCAAYPSTGLDTAHTGVFLPSPHSSLPLQRSDGESDQLQSDKEHQKPISLQLHISPSSTNSIQRDVNDLIARPVLLDGANVLTYEELAAWYGWRKLALMQQRDDLNNESLAVPNSVVQAITSAQELFELNAGGGSEAITEGIVSDARNWLITFTSAMNAAEVEKAAEAARRLRRAEERSRDAQKHLEENIIPQLRDRQRSSFRAEEDSALLQVSDTIGTALDTLMNLKDVILEIRREAAVLENMRNFAAGRTGLVPSANSHAPTVVAILNRINQIYAGFQLLRSGINLINGSHRTEAAGAHSSVSAMATIYSAGGTLLGASAGVSMYANLYIGPMTSACLNALSRLEDVLSRTRNRTLIELGEFDVVNWSLEPGGRSMFNFMRQVMQAGSSRNVPTPVPASVESYLIDHRSSFNAGIGSRRSLMPTTGWIFKDLNQEQASSWIFANRDNLWGMLYGAATPPR